MLKEIKVHPNGYPHPIKLHRTKFGECITIKGADGRTFAFAERNASEREAFNSYIKHFTQEQRVSLYDSM